MQTNSVVVTSSNLQAVKQIFTQQHVTYVANSNMFVTENTVFVAANNAILQHLQDEACISNVLYN